MRKITEQSVEAFYANKDFRKDNTEIVESFEGTQFLLHNNRIALLNGNILEISSCGYKTNTTKERLNGILVQYTNFKIKQIKGVWYIIEDFENKKIEFIDSMKINLDTGEIIN